MQKIDPYEYQKRLNQLAEILKDIVVHADAVSTRRCPYKNRSDQCTAQFGCQNKRNPETPGSLPMCGGDDKLDYRKAWEA